MVRESSELMSTELLWCLDMPLWTPDDLGTGILTAWYKADSIKQDDGSAVATWDDSSGNSNTTSQSATARQPSFEKNELHGRPVVRFDGTMVTLLHLTLVRVTFGWLAYSNQPTIPQCRTSLKKVQPPLACVSWRMATFR